MGRFFKIWAKIGSNLRKIGYFVQNLAQNWADWYMNGLLFLEKLEFVWVYFQIPWWHIPTKTKLEYPPWVVIMLCSMTRKNPLIEGVNSCFYAMYACSRDSIDNILVRKWLYHYAVMVMVRKTYGILPYTGHSQKLLVWISCICICSFLFRSTFPQRK